MAANHIRRQIFSRVTHFIVISVLVLFSVPTLAFAEGETPPVDTTTTTETTETAAPPADPPAPVPAEETPFPPPPEPTPPAPSTTPAPSAPPATPGPKKPTGPDANTYKYNPETGCWENGVYCWNPVTKQTKPLTPQECGYNPATAMWDCNDWRYDPAQEKYVPNTVSTSTPPTDSTIIDNPNTSLDDGIANSDTPLSEALMRSSASALNGNTPQANNSVDANVTGNGIFDLFYNAAISNNLTSTAKTGDAIVDMNTAAGSAISGSATAIANIINMLQSTWDSTAGAFTTFVGNIMGDVVGDLFLDPNQPGNVNAESNLNAKVNATQDTAINNNISLEAVSGDAAVNKNTQAGDAKTGDATAIVNLVNAINSSIAAQQSFLGVLNIFGNLNGDILLPPNLVESLIAANATGDLDTSLIANSEIIGEFNTNQTITNNINSAAVSGGATVANNTTAGSASTGDANTKVTVLNLTGRQVIGSDALLVFVNVMGKWTGLIVNAPQGATAAALGSNITQNSTLAVNSNTNQAITNNIDVSARSGDASVTNNTTAGDATTGDANTAVNVLNMNNSAFSLTGGLRLLFINVWGEWCGSFGIDTNACPTTTPPAVTVPNTSAPRQTANTSKPIQEVRAFRFTPQSNGTYNLDETDDTTAKVALASANVLGDSLNTPAQQTPHEQESQKAQQSNWLFSALGIGIAASLLGTERVLNRRSKKQA